MKIKFIFITLFMLVAKSFAQNDCVDAVIVCGNTESSGLTVHGIGTQELGGIITCSSQENNSIWLKLNINTGGTLSFTLKPESNAITEDFDFFIFGPDTPCNNLGQNLRCSTTNPQVAGQANNLTGLNATETDVSEGPAELGNSFLKELTVNSGESYYLVVDRPIGNSDFSITWGGTATFNAPPVLNIPTTAEGLDITDCDKDLLQDGITDFDLTINTSYIIGSQTNVTVTYYTDSNDAIIAENPIPDPVHFRNTQSPQKVYARITDITSGCFNFTEFNIKVDDIIDVLTDEVSFCDNANDGDDANGVITLDFDDVTSGIFGTTDISGLTIAYFRTEGEAIGNSGALTRFYTNAIPFQQPVYLRVSNSRGCFLVKKINLVINPLPAKRTVTLVQCDTGLNPDGLTLFSLVQATADFTDDDPNFSVTYFENATDELNSSNALSEYINTQNPQQIIARITDNRTQCSNLGTLILNVNVTPSEQKTLYECDVPGTENGFTTFNLNNTGFTIPPTASIAYYKTVEDALLEQNAITDTAAYANIVPYNDTVYARIEDGNNCTGISVVNLVVNKLPNIDTESDGNDFVCSNLPNKFIRIDAGLLEGVPADFSYIWKLDGNLIAPFTYTILVNKPGTYTVEVINSSACRKFRTIVVHPSNDAHIDNIAVEDITTENNTVNIALDPQSIGDYEYSIDEPSGPFQDSGFFEHVRPGFRTVYVRDRNGCGMVSQVVAVLDVPHFFTPNGDGINDFWTIQGVDAVVNSDTYVYVFDRFGKLVKEIPTHDTTGWDGTLNGKALPADDYWYVVHLKDGRTTRGHFTLKR